MWRSDSDLVSAIIVFVGLIIGQMFIYGGRIREKKPVTWTEVYADLLQYGAKYVTCMASLLTIEGLGMYKIVWSKLMYCILFSMSFDKWFVKLREKFILRMTAVSDALLGKLPGDAMMEVPRGSGDSPAQVKATIMSDATRKAVDDISDTTGAHHRVSKLTGRPITVQPMTKGAKQAMLGDSLRANIPAEPVKPGHELDGLIRNIDQAHPDDL